ncbi:hypothetical protein BDN70DRAFT_991104 [Pholiota conissans]|uniref:Uncharacterized protein n=1 Tax=Pholiota conissans TaxID=109636 RepID=A0A9P6D4A9_9AGAR|nr:hypothetical protein BDN70DRAFT_991104 [Pholiota conissans]
MTAYYPSQVGYAAQPVAYGPSQGYAQPGYGMSGYAPSGGVMVSQGLPMAAPVVMQPGYNGVGHGHHNYYSFTARLRRFFGLAPNHGVRYKSDRSTWGFMGYSRRPRYVDPRTGVEVDREGRAVYRV